MVEVASWPFASFGEEQEMFGSGSAATRGSQDLIGEWGDPRCLDAIGAVGPETVAMCQCTIPDLIFPEETYGQGFESPTMSGPA